MSKTISLTIPAELWAELEALSKRTAEILNEFRQAGYWKTTAQPDAVQPVIPTRKRPKHVPKDQEWFWSEEWQAGERQVDEELARGECVEFDNVEDAIQYLHGQV